ncbi:C4-type zinc ribbon domain-containing protein [bacterium]|nr:C4-type zinc ribbon domain-containing protein [bacterium]
MGVNLQPLIQLHFLDREIAVLNSRLSQMPIQIKEVDRKLDRAQRHVQEKQDLIAENQKKRRELEGDLALIETKRKRYKEQLDGVKTNKEYTGLQHEIELVSQAIREMEDQILAQMEEAEILKVQIDEAQKVKDREEKELLDEKRVIQGEADKLEHAMNELKDKRQHWVSQIPPHILEEYERLATHRKGVALAEARDAVCLECQMRIRPQLFQEIRRNDTIITCENCSRILFFIPPPDPELDSTNP